MIRTTANPVFRWTARLAVVVMATAAALAGASQVAAAEEPLFWTEQTYVAGAGGTSHSPAVGYGCDTQYDVVFWKGVSSPTTGSDKHIYFTSAKDGPGQHVMPDWAKTDESPDVDCNGDQVIVVWRDYWSHDIYAAQRNLYTLTWSDPIRVGGPSLSKPSISWTPADLNGTPYNPVHIAWQSDAQSAQYSYSITGSLQYLSAPQPIDTPGAGAPSITMPTLHNVRVAWRETSYDQVAYTTTLFNRDSWTFPAVIPGAPRTSAAPVAMQNWIAWRGLGTDGTVHYARETSPGVWTPVAVICGVGGTSSSPDIGLQFRSSPTTVWLSWRVVWKGASDGSGNDQHLYQTFGTEANRGSACRS